MIWGSLLHQEIIEIISILFLRTDWFTENCQVWHDCSDPELFERATTRFHYPHIEGTQSTLAPC